MPILQMLIAGWLKFVVMRRATHGLKATMKSSRRLPTDGALPAEHAVRSTDSAATRTPASRPVWGPEGVSLALARLLKGDSPQLQQTVGVDRQQDCVKHQDRKQVRKIAVPYERQIAGQRRRT